MGLSEERTAKRKHITSLMEEIGLKNRINRFQIILDAIWSNVFSTPKFDSYLKPRIRTCPGIISSIETLNGINELCEIEDFADAYLLIRKVRDNLFLDLFLFEAQKTLETISGNPFEDLDLNNVEAMMDALYKFCSQCADSEMTKEELIAINKWKDGKLLKTRGGTKTGFFQFSKYVSYLEKNNENFKKCHERFLKEKIKEMGLILNDYAHSNSESIMINKQKPIAVLSNIKKTLMKLEHLFLITLFLVDSTLLASDYYVSCIECDVVPPEGSQYLINEYIQESFVEIRLSDKHVFQFLIEHNTHPMKIETE